MNWFLLWVGAPFFDKYLIKEAQKRLSGLENIFGGTKILSKETSSISGSFGAAILAQDKFERIIDVAIIRKV